MKAPCLISRVPLALERRNGSQRTSGAWCSSKQVTWIACGILGIATLAPFSAVAADPQSEDLFSKITMSDTVTRTAAAAPIAEKNDVILGALSLSNVFLSNQVDADVQAQSVMVRLSDLMPIAEKLSSLKDATLTFSVDAESNRIDILLPLQTIHEESSVRGPGLIKLLTALTAHSNVHLSIQDHALALQTSLANQDVTVDKIRTVVRRVVIAVTDVEPTLASIETKVEAPSAQPKQIAAKATITPTITPSASPVSPSIVGTWSAKTSATDAWAIQLSDDGGFVMVHARGGKNTVSRGQYKFNQSRLTLVESGGLTLKGIVEQPTPKQFSWNLQDANGKTLTTLAFTKQS